VVFIWKKEVCIAGYILSRKKSIHLKIMPLCKLKNSNNLNKWIIINIIKMGWAFLVNHPVYIGEGTNI